MSSPFVAEIRIFPFNFAPKGWAFCNGQLLPISQNTALFSLIGTFYGGDGKSTFALPNLQGSVPIHQGQGPGLSDRFLGESSGVENVTLIQSEIPFHTHSAMGIGTTGGNTPDPGPTKTWGGSIQRPYVNANPNQAMSPNAIGVVGSSAPHNNMQPYLVLNFCIALQGVFPARN